MVLLHHIIVYYITKLHYNRLLYLIMPRLFHSLSIFIFILPLAYFSPSNSVWPCVAFVVLSRICVIVFIIHCVKSVQIRSFFCSVFSCIQSECSKKRTRKNPYLDTFYTVIILYYYLSRVIYSAKIVGKRPTV